MDHLVANQRAVLSINRGANASLDRPDSSSCLWPPVVVYNQTGPITLVRGALKRTNCSRVESANGFQWHAQPSANLSYS